jgi:hypothetical protein
MTQFLLALTPFELLLMAFMVMIAIAGVYEHFTCLRAIDRATSEYRIALEYIRDEECEMPHEFAACWLDGNRMALRRKFRTFARFRQTRVEEIATAEDFA